MDETAPTEPQPGDKIDLPDESGDGLLVTGTYVSPTEIEIYARAGDGGSWIHAIKTRADAYFGRECLWRVTPSWSPEFEQPYGSGKKWVDGTARLYVPAGEG